MSWVGSTASKKQNDKYGIIIIMVMSYLFSYCISLIFRGVKGRLCLETDTLTRVSHLYTASYCKT